MALEPGASKYVAVRARLVDQLRGLSAGDRLPSESELCRQFGVSRITIRHAVDGLVRDGRLTRQQGRGTFVTDRPAPEPLREHFTDIVTGFHQQQTARGNLVETRVLRQELQAATPAVAQRLRITDGAPVIELVRVRRVNGQLHHHVVTYLSFQRFPEAFTADFSAVSLFDLLTGRYGIQFGRNDLTVRVEPVEADIAPHLDVVVGSALLSIESTVADQADIPAAFGIARYAPHHGGVSLVLRRPGATA